jgi:hypothetical protein
MLNLAKVETEEAHLASLLGRIVPSGRWWLLVIVLQTLAFSCALLFTALPLGDEGFYAVPAHAFSLSGKLQNSVLESAGVPHWKVSIKPFIGWRHWES